MRTIFESKRTWEGYGVEEFTKAIDEMIKFYTKGSDIILSITFHTILLPNIAVKPLALAMGLYGG